MLGNPFVVGGASAESLTDNADSSDDFVAAFQVKDKDKLDALLKAEGQGAGRAVRRQDLQERRDRRLAGVEDDVLVVASSQKLLEDALDQRDKDDRLTAGGLRQGPRGPARRRRSCACTRDVEALLKSDPDTADAQRIKWVKALRTFGADRLAKDDAIDVDFNLATDGDLTDADLPIASGDEAPGVLKQPGEIGLGLRDLAQIVKFAEAAGQAVDPGGYGDYPPPRARSSSSSASTSTRT